MEYSQFKVVVVGPSGAGKTAISMRYMHDQFNDAFVATIGASYLAKKVHCSGKSFTLQIWDTAGQERYQAMCAVYFRSSVAALMVFDLTKPSTLPSLRKWIEMVREKGRKDIILTIVGNKCDLPERAISREEAEEFAAEYGAPYFETSAKSGESTQSFFLHCLSDINESFNSIIRAIAEKCLSPEPLSDPVSVPIQKINPLPPGEAEKRRYRCC